MLEATAACESVLVRGFKLNIARHGLSGTQAIFHRDFQRSAPSEASTLRKAYASGDCADLPKDLLVLASPALGAVTVLASDRIRPHNKAIAVRVHGANSS